MRTPPGPATGGGPGLDPDRDSGHGRPTRESTPPLASALSPEADHPDIHRSRSTPEGTGPIPSLTSKQRAHLRSLAHHLKPVLHVGNDGVTDAVTRSVDEAFNTRELLKVKVQEGAPVDAATAGETLARSVFGAHLVQVIGRTIVLYRPSPDDPEIRLPR